MRAWPRPLTFWASRLPHSPRTWGEERHSHARGHTAWSHPTSISYRRARGQASGCRAPRKENATRIHRDPNPEPQGRAKRRVSRIQPRRFDRGVSTAAFRPRRFDRGVSTAAFRPPARGRVFCRRPLNRALRGGKRAASAYRSYRDRSISPSISRISDAILTRAQRTPRRPCRIGSKGPSRAEGRLCLGEPERRRVGGIQQVVLCPRTAPPEPPQPALALHVFGYA